MAAENTGFGRRPRIKRLLRAVWLLMIVITVIGSLLPSSSPPIQTLELLPLSDKFEHFAMYAVLVLLPALHERRRFILLTVFGAIALGIALEYAQLYSGWRDFEIADMIAGAAGAVLGVAVGIPLRCIVSSRFSSGRLGSKFVSPGFTSTAPGLDAQRGRSKDAVDAHAVPPQRLT